MESVILVAAIAFAVLNIILFFKVWGMTNDVTKIANHVERIANRINPDSTAQPQEQTQSPDVKGTSTETPGLFKEIDNTPIEGPSKGEWVGIAFAALIILFIILYAILQ